MEAIVTAGCGLDVHAAVIVGCLLVGGPHGKPRKEVRKFGTMTRDLEALRAWLREAGCMHVAMESTGVYWKPVHGGRRGEAPGRGERALERGQATGQ